MCGFCLFLGGIIFFPLVGVLSNKHAEIGSVPNIVIGQKTNNRKKVEESLKLKTMAFDERQVFLDHFFRLKALNITYVRVVFYCSD